MGTWGPPGSCQPQMGPMLAPCYQGIALCGGTASLLIVRTEGHQCSSGSRGRSSLLPSVPVIVMTMKTRTLAGLALLTLLWPQPRQMASSPRIPVTFIFTTSRKTGLTPLGLSNIAGEKCHYHSYWCPGDARNQCTSSDGIGIVGVQKGIAVSMKTYFNHQRDMQQDLRWYVKVGMGFGILRFRIEQVPSIGWYGQFQDIIKRSK